MSSAAVPQERQAAGLMQDVRVLMMTAWMTYPRLLVLQVVLLLATGLTGGMSMLLLIPVVNAVTTKSGGATIQIPVLDALDLSAVPLPVLLLAVVLLVSAQALLVRWSSINSVTLQQRIVDRLRADAFGAILAARWSFVLQTRRSELTEIATIGANRAGTAFNALLQGAVSAVLGVATAVVSAVIAPALTVLVVLGMGILLVVLLRSVRPAHAMGREYGRRNRILQSVMFDSMDSLRLVRAHDAQDTWREQLRDAFASTRQVQAANVRRTSTVLAFGSIGLIVSASILVLVAVEAQMPSATIVLVLLLAARMAGTVRALASSMQTAANSLPAVQDLNDLTRRAEAEAEAPEGSSEFPPSDPDAPTVRLVDVSYAYVTSGHGVTDLSFDVPRGQITALIGPSGAGKSTTADIVLGLLAPASGRVEVEGVVLTPERLSAWRRRIAYVPQETILLPGTVRRNLLWSIRNRDVTDDDCWAAIDQAEAGFVRDLPNGLDSDLGDRGTQLSGGQRQRLAIARALLRQPDLLVMDEATSSLDDATESAVMEAVRRLTPRLTVLVIAHRRSTIDAAHYVVELREGRVVSRGLGRALSEP